MINSLYRKYFTSRLDTLFLPLQLPSISSFCFSLFCLFIFRDPECLLFPGGTIVACTRLLVQQHVHILLVPPLSHLFSHLDIERMQMCSYSLDFILLETKFN